MIFSVQETAVSAAISARKHAIIEVRTGLKSAWKTGAIK